MESHEEKLHNMIKQSKMDSAKDQAARQAKAIKERQREMVRHTACRPRPLPPIRKHLPLSPRSEHVARH